MASYRLVSDVTLWRTLRLEISRKGKGMNNANEKKLAKRATELGNSADPKAFSHLAELVTSESPLVRRLAALGNR